eukprot:TRINITY_DN2414_c0_g1_i2.p1 TRINITY_DN2414_c0_g1~~TRINITY_DN2414_c0_g1_i2.p1  ORF type:complete len:475 (-),score=124.07 TRINITY_DN2414_c0_g1_i2:31-1455(-)
MELDSTTPINSEQEKEKQAKFDSINLTTKKKDQQDFSELVSKRLPELKQLAQQGNLSGAIDGLFALEKTTRNGEDVESTKQIAITVVQLCFDNNKNIPVLIESLNYLSKRRGQMKQVIQAMVQEAMKYLNDESIPSVDTQIQLIDTLRSITEGKIFVENERARLSKKLATIYESQNKISLAAEVLQEIQVETFGSMQPQEKIEFILEQMRLTLAKRDFIRAQIISKKITNKALSSNPELEPLKIQYYKLLIQYYNHEKDYLNITRSYRYIYDTKLVQNDDKLRSEYLKLLSLYIILSPFGNEQNDLIYRISDDKHLINLPLYKEFLKLFTTQELIVWPELEQNYKAELNSLEVFGKVAEDGEKLWKELRSRVMEHNIRVVAKYYERINIKRFADLLNADVKETEKCVSDMVSGGGVWAKMDRPKGIVNFRKRQDPNDVLNNWSHDVGELLSLLDKTCHLISRETMVNEKRQAQN